ncbi:nucleotide pyrophosphohydrolase [Candidatus Saccharibacteria bacterium]|nr:nucleotide pyrophosphohydrolase [Candidatus Saccharibacteria bacterium]
MNLDEVQARSLRIKQAYDALNAKNGHKKWGASDYMAGFVKDAGDLSKLLMVKNGLRGYEGNLEHDIQHEIGDCFWSLFVMCSELNIAPQDAMELTLTELEGRLHA